MKFFKITVLVVALAMLGSAFTVDAKVKKRRSTIKKEKQMKKACTYIRCRHICAVPLFSTSKSNQSQQCILDMVEYQYQGMMMSPVAKVRVERKNGKVVLAIKGTSTDEKEYAISDGEEILKEALAIIEQEKMMEYARSYELPPEMDVLDGYFWSFGARLADGRSVNSSGHNAGPSDEGREKIHSLLFKRAFKEIGMDY